MSLVVWLGTYQKKTNGEFSEPRMQRLETTVENPTTKQLTTPDWTKGLSGYPVVMPGDIGWSQSVPLRLQGCIRTCRLMPFNSQ